MAHDPAFDTLVDEQLACLTLWADLHALLKRTQPPPDGALVGR
jgi:hypothetical protein